MTAEAVQRQVDHRRDEERDGLRKDQASHHRQAQRLAQLGSGADADGNRQGAHQRGQRGHHDGPEAQDAGLADRLRWCHATMSLRIERKVNHHDGVLLHDADQQHDANRGNQRQILTKQHQRGQGAYGGRRKTREDGDGVDVALVQHTQQHVDYQQRGDDENRLAALRTLEDGCVAAVSRNYRGRHLEERTCSVDLGSGIAQCHTRCQVKGHRDSLQLTDVVDGSRAHRALHRGEGRQRHQGTR